MIFLHFTILGLLVYLFLQIRVSFLKINAHTAGRPYKGFLYESFVGSSWSWEITTFEFHYFPVSIFIHYLNFSDYKKLSAVEQRMFGRKHRLEAAFWLILLASAASLAI